MLNFEKYSLPTFEIYEKPVKEVQAVLYNINNLNYFDEYSQSTYTTKSLIGLDDIFNIIDKEQFMYDTTLQPVIDFNERLAEFKARFVWEEAIEHISKLNNDYKPDVTDKFNWKRGIYDYMRGMVDYYEKRHMRNSGIDTFFNRIYNNKWAVNNFRDKLNRLEQARLKARRVSIRDINTEELNIMYNNFFEQIKSNTKAANQMSDNFKIYNYISAGGHNGLTSMTTKKHLYLQLSTVVMCKSKTMDIILTDGSKIGEMLLPNTYLLFERKLYQSLMNHPRQCVTQSASCPGGRHPYIASHGPNFYDRDNNSEGTRRRVTGQAWNTLCLSSFNDEVRESLKKNDYMSMLMALSSWNSIYNIEQTNPHIQPKNIFYQTGFHFGNNTEENIESLKHWTAFSKNNCFKQEVRDRVYIEDDEKARSLNTQVRNEEYIVYYGKDVISTCDSKKCPFVDTCLGYYRTKNFLLNEEFQYMLESIVGWLYEEWYDEDSLYSQDDKSKYYISKMYAYLQAVNYDSETDLLPEIYENGLTYGIVYAILYDLKEYNYWGKPVEEKHSNNEEAELSMPDKLVAWSVSQNNERRSANGR